MSSINSIHNSSNRVRLAALAALLLGTQLSPAPLFAKPAAMAPQQTEVDAAGWLRPDSKMDRFIADLMAKMTLDETIGPLTLLTSNWESNGPPMRCPLSKPPRPRDRNRTRVPSPA